MLHTYIDIITLLCSFTLFYYIRQVPIAQRTVVRIYFTIVIRYAIALRMILHIHSLGLLVFVVVVIPRPTDRPRRDYWSSLRVSQQFYDNKKSLPPARYT